MVGQIFATTPLSLFLVRRVVLANHFLVDRRGLTKTVLAGAWHNSKVSLFCGRGALLTHSVWPLYQRGPCDTKFTTKAVTRTDRLLHGEDIQGYTFYTELLTLGDSVCLLNQNEQQNRIMSTQKMQFGHTANILRTRSKFRPARYNVHYDVRYDAHYMNVEFWTTCYIIPTYIVRFGSRSSASRFSCSACR